mgnify:CR=1 FL=1
METTGAGDEPGLSGLAEHAAVASFGRFADGDLASILAANPPGQRRSAGDVHSLQTGTSAWEGFGR